MANELQSLLVLFQNRLFPIPGYLCGMLGNNRRIVYGIKYQN
jgi:hypothetical protein